MSTKSEKQFEVIIEKLDQLLEENKQLKTLIAQKDDELSLQKEQIAFLTQKLYGPKKETLKGDPNQVISSTSTFLVNQSRLVTKATKMKPLLQQNVAAKNVKD